MTFSPNESVNLDSDGYFIKLDSNKIVAIENLVLKVEEIKE